ncbi:hypothetical protein [Streptomyces fractus]
MPAETRDGRDGRVRAGLESFHPKNPGTSKYDQVMDQTPAGIGYAGG